MGAQRSVCEEGMYVYRQDGTYSKHTARVYAHACVIYTRVCSSVQDNSFQPGPVAYQLIKCLIISIHFIIYTLPIYHLYGVQLKGKGIRCPSPFR